MRALVRGLLALALTATGAVATVSALPAPIAAAAAASPMREQSVHSCSQQVARGHYTCFALRRTDAAAAPTTRAGHAAGHAAVTRSSQAVALTPHGLTPASLQAAYALPSTSVGFGHTVFVVDAYDDPNAESDLATYRAQWGLPACTTANGCFSKVNQNGVASPLPGVDSGWAGEISLDLDMVSAICPNCHITLVESFDAGSNLLTAVKRATTMGAKYVSMSWGGPENGSEPSYDASYFASAGVVFTASSGDYGYAAGTFYPATSSRVVSVGGTSLSPSATPRGWTETAWSDTGSGCSVSEAKPTWQSSIAGCSRRVATDVSAVADPETGVAVYQTYGANGWSVYGGTSASAPIIAAVYALAGSPAKDAHPANSLYAHRSSLYDVTSGSTGTCSPSTLCHAGVGWDGPTGLGTPNGLRAFGAGLGTTPGAVVGAGWPRPPTVRSVSVVAARH